MKNNKNKRNKSSKQQFHTQFHMEDGSHLKELDPSSMDWSGNDTCFLYFITKEEVEACDTSRLLHDLRPELDNPFFKSGPGSVIFSVSGYDEDPRDLLLIPEFRNFAKKTQEKAPCWLYFAAPEGAWLRIILAASNSQSLIRDAKDGTIRIGLSTFEIAKFMDRQIKQYDSLCELLGIDPDVIDDHLWASADDSFSSYGFDYVLA